MVLVRLGQEVYVSVQLKKKKLKMVTLRKLDLTDAWLRMMPEDFYR